MESSNLSILRGDDRPIRARADAITRYAGGRFVRGRGRGRGHGRWACGCSVLGQSLRIGYVLCIVKIVSVYSS